MATRTVCVQHPDIEVTTHGCRTCLQPLRLTYDELLAGVACRGCGRPFRGVRQELKGLDHMTPIELEIEAAERQRYDELHHACAGGRHGLSGYLERHCGSCCPVPPPSLETLAKIVAIMRRARTDLAIG